MSIRAMTEVWKNSKAKGSVLLFMLAIADGGLLVNTLMGVIISVIPSIKRLAQGRPLP